MAAFQLKPLRSDEDHAKALARIDALLEAEPGTPAGDELDVLVDLVEHYEGKHHAIGWPTALAAIEFRMEQAGLTPRDLEPYIGSRARVSEVLSGKRPLTMAMARALHEHLGIPAEALLRAPEHEPDRPSSVDVAKLPIRQMRELGFFGKVGTKGDLSAVATRWVSKVVMHAGGALRSPTLLRQSEHARANAKSNLHALQAWCWHVLALADARAPRAKFHSGIVTLGFLRDVGRLSWKERGPQLAREFLEDHGIPLVVAPHLQKTYLDGAALKLADGRPVVALTLRHDRLDNFWFCLMHELAHVGRHLARSDEAFVDDLDLPATEGDAVESEADEWASEALVPAAAWEASRARVSPTPSSVVELAKELDVHPAIVAGRVRHERKDYRLLSHFVGRGEVRRHFPEWKKPEKP